MEAAGGLGNLDKHAPRPARVHLQLSHRTLCLLQLPGQRGAALAQHAQLPLRPALPGEGGGRRRMHEAGSVQHAWDQPRV